jgi:predicted negative regulator of RcsB-dependent stress response
MKNFLSNNLTEEELVEQIKQWIRSKGIFIIIGIILVLSGVWGFNYYKSYQVKLAKEARVLYLSIVENPDEKILNNLRANYSNSGYVSQAEMVMAKNAVENKDYENALNYLLPITKNDELIIANIARLRAANIYFQTDNLDQALSIINQADKGYLSALFNNLKGDIYLAQNKLILAKEQYRLALESLLDNSELKSLITIKLNDIN